MKKNTRSVNIAHLSFRAQVVRGLRSPVRMNRSRRIIDIDRDLPVKEIIPATARVVSDVWCWLLRLPRAADYDGSGDTVQVGTRTYTLHTTTTAAGLYAIDPWRRELLIARDWNAHRLSVAWLTAHALNLAWTKWSEQATTWPASKRNLHHESLPCEEAGALAADFEEAILKVMGQDVFALAHTKPTPSTGARP